MLWLLAGGLVSFVVLLGVGLSRQPRALAVAYVIAGSTFLPLVSADKVSISAGSALFLVALVLGEVRSRFTAELTPSRPSGLVLTAVALLCWMLLVRLQSGSPLGLQFAVTAVIVALLIVASRLRAGEPLRVTVLLQYVLLFHAVYACGELFANLPPLWPMGNGTTDIHVRPQTFLSMLPGRPMTSFAHPIPMAMFALVVGIASLYFSLGKLRSRHFFFATTAAALVILSGTRSAVLAFGLATAVIVIYALRLSKLGRAALLAGVTAVGFAATQTEALFGALGLGQSFQDSYSFQHRSAVLGSFPGLFDQDLARVLFGWGTERELIFSLGIVRGVQPGAVFFDNQFVAAMAMYGAVGFALFVAVNLLAFIRGDALGKGLVVAHMFMAVSFDFLQFYAASATWALAIGLCVASARDRTARKGELHATSVTQGTVLSANMGGSSRGRRRPLSFAP